MSLIPTLILSLGSSPFPPQYIPDPEYNKSNNYTTLNTKVLNFAHTPANDNYIPYRQAQFFVNHSNPEKDSFISEWGVSFFQRTVLMGSVVSSFYTLLNDNPPIAYTWAAGSQDLDSTYAKFQIIAHILNSLLIIPAFIILRLLFNRKTALLSSIFIASSHFYMYNSIFSWPKSLTAFFILLSMIFLIEKRRHGIMLAGIIAGIAYLTHDLAIIFIATSLVFLLLKKRFRDLVIYLVSSMPFPAVWAFISSFIYHKPSTFFYYPFALDGLPQEDTKSKLIPAFFATNPLHILKIKVDGIVWLLSPYQLTFLENNPNTAMRLWAVGIYTIPGSLGLGLMILGIYSLLLHFKKIKWEVWFFIFFPVLIILFLFGNPMVLGSLHFSEPIVALLIGLIIFTALHVKKYAHHLVVGALAVNIAYFIFFVLYSYNFDITAMTKNFYDIMSLLLIGAIFVYLLLTTSKIFLEKRSPLINILGV